MLLRLYLKSLRLDVFGLSKDYLRRKECNLKQDEIILWPFYKEHIPGRADAEQWLKDRYGSSVMKQFVCSEGSTGNANGVAPFFLIDDFSPGNIT